MKPETVNIAAPPPSKLSKLQKTILRVMHDLYEDNKRIRKKYSIDNPRDVYFWPIRPKRLSWAIAEAYGKQTHLTRNEVMADFRVRKVKALTEIARDAPQFLNFANIMWNRRRRFRDILTPSFRASLSRSLSRLEARGLIKRERYKKTSRWTKPKTTGIYLTPQGREVARQLPSPEC